MEDFGVMIHEKREHVYPVLDVKKTGENILRLCKKRGLTVKKIQEYMAFACPQTIYRWFSGQALPSVDNLYALSRMLDMAVDDILIGEYTENMIYFHCQCDKKRSTHISLCYANIGKEFYH